MPPLLRYFKLLSPFLKTEGRSGRDQSPHREHAEKKSLKPALRGVIFLTSYPCLVQGADFGVLPPAERSLNSFLADLAGVLRRVEASFEMMVVVGDELPLKRSTLARELAGLSCPKVRFALARTRHADVESGPSYSLALDFECAPYLGSRSALRKTRR